MRFRLTIWIFVFICTGSLANGKTAGKTTYTRVNKTTLRVNLEGMPITINCPLETTLTFLKEVTEYDNAQIKSVKVDSNGLITFKVLQDLNGHNVDASLTIQPSAGCAVKYPDQTS